MFWIFHACPTVGQKGSKTVVTQLELRMGTNPFRLLLVSSRATKRHNSQTERRVTPKNVPSFARAKELSWVYELT